MKLRVARKMDQKPPHYPGHRKDKRVWWKVYSVDQLAQAERRLNRAWLRACPRRVELVAGGVEQTYRAVNEDFFRKNRVASRRIRQAEINRINRRKASTP